MPLEVVQIIRDQLVAERVATRSAMVHCGIERMDTMAVLLCRS